jgi:hypothetical protein
MGLYAVFLRHCGGINGGHLLVAHPWVRHAGRVVLRVNNDVEIEQVESGMKRAMMAQRLSDLGFPRSDYFIYLLSWLLQEQRPQPHRRFPRHLDVE